MMSANVHHYNEGTVHKDATHKNTTSNTHTHTHKHTHTHIHTQGHHVKSAHTHVCGCSLNTVQGFGVEQTEIMSMRAWQRLDMTDMLSVIVFA
jgi:hypothetical protein